jgi:hypothetical protein
VTIFSSTGTQLSTGAVTFNGCNGGHTFTVNLTPNNVQIANVAEIDVAIS